MWSFCSLTCLLFNKRVPLSLYFCLLINVWDKSILVDLKWQCLHKSNNWLSTDWQSVCHRAFFRLAGYWLVMVLLHQLAAEFYLKQMVSGRDIYSWVPQWGSVSALLKTEVLEVNSPRKHDVTESETWNYSIFEATSTYSL